MLHSGTPLIFDPCGREHKMSTCWPPHSRAWIGASLKQHATGRFTAPFVIKDHLKAGLKFDKYLGLLGQRAMGRYIPAPSPLHQPASWTPMHTKAQRKELSPHFKLWRKLHFCPCSRDHKQGVFYCRGLNDSRNHLGGKQLHLWITFIKTGPPWALDI